MALKHEPGLDGLRAVAIAAVMGFHYMPRTVTGGSLGVDVFFVLSGWLITSILMGEIEKTGRVDYGAFLRRRFFRLTPPLAALLVAYVLLAPWLLPKVAATRWLDAGVTAAYLTNIRYTFWPADNPLSHTWFLALQGQFYLLWPLILWPLSKLGRNRAAIALIVMWVVLTLARWMWNETIGGPGAYYLTPLHATGLLLGAALALHPIKVRWSWLALAPLIGLIAFGHTKQSFLIQQTAVELATVALVASPPRILAWPPLPFIGAISYGIYLWHVPFMWIFPPKTWPVRIGLIVASLVAGWLTHIALEKPFGRKPKAPAPA